MSAPAHWVRCTLDAIKADSDNAIAGGPFGSDLTQADYVDDPDGVPVIRGCNLGHGERRFTRTSWCSCSRARPTRCGARRPIRATSSSPSAAPSRRSASSPTTCRGGASCCRRAR
ncbi:hypothetical protein [Nannocystis pusilla]|uniref:hypothetical protein n=1 Tax=Nannocystis pusilla TaxID=889268 RepID=UPI003B7ED366